MNDELREQLAAVQHEIWAHWMQYLFNVCETSDGRDGQAVIIPADKVQRWQRQVQTPYETLSEKEKESDRHQADKILAILSAAPRAKAIE